LSVLLRSVNSGPQHYAAYANESVRYRTYVPARADPAGAACKAEARRRAVETAPRGTSRIRLRISISAATGLIVIRYGTAQSVPSDQAYSRTSSACLPSLCSAG
jgi:hypothetical protein